MRLSFFLILGLLPACSIYRSNGRNQFEEKAPGRVLTEIGVSSTPTCWLQSTSDPIWPKDFDGPFTVRPYDQNQVSVCLGRLHE